MSVGLCTANVRVLSSSVAFTVPIYLKDANLFTSRPHNNSSSSTITTTLLCRQLIVLRLLYRPSQRGATDLATDLSSALETGQLYHGRREGRIAVRRAIQLNSQPVSSSSTTLGLLNAQVRRQQGHIHLRPHRRRPSSSVRSCRDVARLCRQSSANRVHAAWLPIRREGTPSNNNSHSDSKL